MNQNRAADCSCVYCRPWTVTLDFNSELALREFYEAFDDKIVQLDEKIIMKMHFVEMNGPTEQDWFKAFYGESRVKSACPSARCWSPFPHDCRSLPCMHRAVEQAFRVSEAGSRPDTVLLRNVPAEWFGIPYRPIKDDYASKGAPFRRAMSKFGPIAYAACVGVLVPLVAPLLPCLMLVRLAYVWLVVAQAHPLGNPAP